MQLVAYILILCKQQGPRQQVQVKLPYTCINIKLRKCTHYSPLETDELCGSKTSQWEYIDATCNPASQLYLQLQLEKKLPWRPYWYMAPAKLFMLYEWFHHLRPTFNMLSGISFLLRGIGWVSQRSNIRVDPAVLAHDMLMPAPPFPFLMKLMNILQRGFVGCS